MICALCGGLKKARAGGLYQQHDWQDCLATFQSHRRRLADMDQRIERAKEILEGLVEEYGESNEGRELTVAVEAARAIEELGGVVE